MNRLSPEMDAKVREALRLIEHGAQSSLNAACRQLCSVPGYGEAWTRVANLADLVKAEWYRLEGQRARQQREPQPVD